MDTEIVAVSQYRPSDEEPTILANFLTFKSSLEDAQTALQSLHDSRPPGAVEEIYLRTTNLTEQYVMQDMANPPNHRYCSDNAYVRNDADVPSVLDTAFTTLPTRKSCSLYFAMSPTSRRELPDMALSMQSDHYFAVYTVWEDAADDERCCGWVRDVLAGVERQSVGSYLGDADFQTRRTKFWSEEKGARLMEVRRKWDPKGRVCGYLDVGDRGGVEGLKNVFEWE